MRSAWCAAAVALALLAPPPEPPPVRSQPPPGHRPGPAAGLLAPPRCTPWAAQPHDGPDPVAERLRLGAAHRLAKGKGQLIAVIDTGVAPHPQLGDRLRGGGDYIAGGDGLDDCDGHGTAVAGILAANGAGGDRVVGMAPAARLLSIRHSSQEFTVAGPDGTAQRPGSAQTLADAVVLAVREGATVINISEALCLPAAQAGDLGDPLHAALRHAVRSDVVVVAAAGNVDVGGCAAGSPDQVALPGWYGSALITVGAVDPDDEPAPFTVPGAWVDVAAPGTGLRSLAVGGGTTTRNVTGTSFATPWVAGLAALIRERFPELDAAGVAERIVETARRPPGGRDDRVGHGVIDPVAALTAVLPATAAPTQLPVARLDAGTPPQPAPAQQPAELIAVAALVGAATLAATRTRRR
ncbi:type VII secretion-associated serine protease mycosin [Pseudonocardia sp. TRM90224]|uniref:type VII secretion-associated serine protease mycosin n=1 Tax=Pseudonocardia sp. TRM90224 TaxID=2812678 RepID=UPI001E649781|nr:type VII secretion-associated serine protease mycosin [Pseudonocardia sp. TRM90224]